jgi:hypothetical protein
MRDDDIDGELPPDDPVSTLLDRLDSTEDFGAPGEVPPPSPALNRRELDRLVDQVVDEEVKRITGRKE